MRLDRLGADEQPLSGLPVGNTDRDDAGQLGVGVDANIVTASLHAVAAAVNRTF